MLAPLLRISILLLLHWNGKPKQDLTSPVVAGMIVSAAPCRVLAANTAQGVQDRISGIRLEGMDVFRDEQLTMEVNHRLQQKVSSPHIREKLPGVVLALLPMEERPHLHDVCLLDVAV